MFEFFFLLPIMNNATMKITMQDFMWPISISLGHIPRVELLGHMTTSCSTFKELPHDVQSGCTTFIPMSEASTFSTSLPTLVAVYLQIAFIAI
jgi:hypothetical protein